MKANLEFQLPEEREDFDLALNGYKYKLAMDDYDGWLRGLDKYGDKTEVGINEAREKLRECLETYFD